MLITAVCIASKTYDSIYYDNVFYQKVGGISTLAEMNLLEVSFLKMVDYNVFVYPIEFHECYRDLLVSV